MADFFINLRWKLYDFYSTQLLLLGLKIGHIRPYSEKLIEKLRDVYYGGVPASVLLLCRSLSDGHCYDRALLMSKIFLDEPGDVKLVYATVADIKFNPIYLQRGNDPDHCFVERVTEDGKHFIYDTSTGFVYNKWIYWLMNFPKIRLINGKDSITKFIREESSQYPEEDSFTDSKFVLDLIIPQIEATYNKNGEMYAMLGILQREIEFFKKRVVSRPQKAQI